MSNTENRHRRIFKQKIQEGMEEYSAFRAHARWESEEVGESDLEAPEKAHPMPPCTPVEPHDCEVCHAPMSVFCTCGCVVDGEWVYYGTCTNPQAHDAYERLVLGPRRRRMAGYADDSEEPSAERSMTPARE